MLFHPLSPESRRAISGFFVPVAPSFARTRDEGQEHPPACYRQTENHHFVTNWRVFMRFATLALLVVTLFSSGVARRQDNQPSLPATDAGKHVAAHLQAFNASEEKSMSEFFLAHTAKEALQRNPVEQRVSRFRQMKQRLGSLTLVKVLDASETLVSALLRTKDGGLVQLDYEFEPNSPHGLLGIRVQDVEDAPRIQPTVKPSGSITEALTATEGLLDSLAQADEFSGVALVASNGKVIFEKAYGFADRDTKVPNRIDTKFNLGSINKTFTAMAIQQLAAEGKLSLTDPIGKYLPDYPNKSAAERVTIQHLLDMTSGIGDFFGERYMAAAKEKLRTIKNYFPLFADKPLEFEPGARRRYSNGGYVVLGAIIEQTSGQDYYTYVREHIFKPAGMTETDSFEKDKTVPNRAVGYTREGQAASGPRQSNYSTLPARGSSAGGGFSTVHDLLNYVTALQEGKLKTREAQGGLGIAGGAPGMNACIEWNPRLKHVVIVLSNYDPPSAESVAGQISLLLPH
jgi:CubicO group peptidase (beta-lactamase class C family)